MTRLVSPLVILLCISTSVLATDDRTVEFRTIEIYLHSQDPVAAWQFELVDLSQTMTIVGVENGDASAFSDAPYFDRNAIQAGDAERIVVADYSIQPSSELPIGQTRITTIHVQLSGIRPPDIKANLITAVTNDGANANATLTIGFGEGSR